jgi:hypothetical protein
MDQAGRTCGTCTLCCKVMEVGEIAKPQGAWCAHCTPGKGCAIYDARPGECHTFQCEWLLNDAMGPEWKPEKSKFVLVRRRGRIVAHLDPATPSAWRKSPYREGFAHLVQQVLSGNELVYVAVNRHYTLLLPDREVDLGELSNQDEVALKMVQTPRGMEYQVEIHRP